MNDMKELLELTGFSTKKELNEGLYEQIILIARSNNTKEINLDVTLSVFIALAGGLYLKDWRRYVDLDVLKEMDIETELDQLFLGTSMHYLLLSDKGFLYKTEDTVAANNPLNELKKAEVLNSGERRLFTNGLTTEGSKENEVFSFINDVVIKTDLQNKLKQELEKIIKAENLEVQVDTKGMEENNLALVKDNR
ncbi:hypothetical protein [Bacillus toyonensis]|uniref:hypothetical protein n=1 Tax=Bacillus toyonensis TaxID=155322 RepID=UPI002E205036|nr:hypothetical protein [Bacillus toyonensis]